MQFVQSVVKKTVLHRPDRLDTESDKYFTTDHLRDNLAGRSFQGAVVILAGQAVTFLLGLFSTAVMARLLHPQDFGLVAMVTSITAFAGLFKDLGLSNATVQRSQITDAQVSFLFWVNVALSLMVTLIIIALAPVIAWFYHEPRLLAITCTLSLNFIFSGLTVQHQALLRRQMRFSVLALRNINASVCGIVIGIALAWCGFGYWSIVAALFSTNLINCVLVWTVCEWRPSAFRLRVGARPMLAFGGNFAAFNILNYLTRNFDNILIGRVLGSGPLGIYSKAYGLLMLPIAQVNQPMATVLLAGLSRLQGDAKEYADLFMKAVRGIALLTIPIVIFCFFFSTDVVLVLLGRRWLPVAPVFQFLAPAALFGAISFVPGWLCQSLGRTRRQFHYALVSAPVCVTGFLIGIKWGITGVAISFSIAFSILFCAYVWYASQDSPVRFLDICVVFFSVLFPALAAGSITCSVRYLLATRFGPIPSLLTYGCLFIAIYVTAVLLSQANRVLVLSAMAWLRTAVGAFWLRNKLPSSSTSQSC